LIASRQSGFLVYTLQSCLQLFIFFTPSFSHVKKANCAAATHPSPLIFFIPSFHVKKRSCLTAGRRAKQPPIKTNDRLLQFRLKIYKSMFHSLSVNSK